ncbi:MAG: hypothetical protein AB7L17_10590 [Ilumatobacteraceae bacterium]
MTASLAAGQRYASVVCSTEVVVVRAPGGDVDLRCGGVAMQPPGRGHERGSPVPGSLGGTLLGKRYTTADETVEVLCIKPGEGSLAIGDVPLIVKTAAALPSSD